MNKYWYKKHITMCPVCGNEKIERERMYTEKPKEYESRYVILEIYDWCNE